MQHWLVKLIYVKTLDHMVFMQMKKITMNAAKKINQRIIKAAKMDLKMMNGKINITNQI